MGKFIKNRWALILAVVALGAVFFYFKFDLFPVDSRAQLTLHFENGESRKFEGVVTARMTVLEALYFASLGGDFELNYSILEDGVVRLAKMSGITNLGNKTWHFYLNDKFINTADINKIRVEPNDTIEAKYE